MKNLFILAIAFVSLNALADGPTLACFTANFDANGTITALSSNGVEIVVITDGMATPYVLKDDFSLYHPMYNLKSPLSMSLLKSFGNASAVTVLDNSITATWVMSDDGTTKTTASLMIDLTTSTGTIATTQNLDSDGSWSGSYSPNLICSTAGLVN